MDRLQSMRVFQQVVEEGGFAAAARKLGLATAVVSRLVSDLEQHLGVRLLQRTTRSLSLTQAGATYLERLRVILGEIDTAEAMVQDQAQEMSGIVRVLAPPIVAVHLLAPAVVDFQREHPDVRVDVQVEDSPDPAVHEYDLAVLSGATTIDPGFVARPIIYSESVLCASPAYLRQRGEPAAPEDLLRHRVLRLRLPATRLGPLRLLDPANADHVLEVDVVPAFTANHSDTLLRAMLEGGGIGTQPIDIIAPLLEAGTLQRVLAPWITARLSLLAAMPSRKFMPSRTRAFLDHLLQHARGTLANLELDLPQP
ncbi:MAG TPA: LysR family transcriptional regulator [Ramlibacter sp.]|uniref:LysR family transcriptional regulator n=1 Tax=Ramlibacter sp. TaxID=1917967 RepID=UPI002D7FD2B0|nr:LysR family transcriptional regulator [Ramlibacter sp.]HET8746918.1 LysR family transcriptional regulator [Ramlibacter sp.]